jgi:hypothetical protein
VIRYEWLARVRLADDRVIESVLRENLPDVGYVPGDDVHVFRVPHGGEQGRWHLHILCIRVGDERPCGNGDGGPTEVARRVDLGPGLRRGSERSRRSRKRVEPGQ